MIFKMDFLKKKGNMIHIAINIACLLFLTTYTMKLRSRITQLEQVVQHNHVRLDQQEQQIRYLISPRRRQQPSVPKEPDYVFPEMPTAPTPGYVHVEVAPTPKMPATPPDNANVFDISFLAPMEEEKPELNVTEEDLSILDEHVEEDLDKEVDEELKKMNIEIKEEDD